jgi:hypothetical protein
VSYLPVIIGVLFLIAFYKERYPAFLAAGLLWLLLVPISMLCADNDFSVSVGRSLNETIIFLTCFNGVLWLFSLAVLIIYGIKKFRRING